MDEPMRNEKRAFIRGRDFVATMASLASAGFGVTAALAWNSAIQAVVEEYLSKGGKIASKFIYAALVTVIAIIVVNSLAKMSERLGGEKRL